MISNDSRTTIEDSVPLLYFESKKEVVFYQREGFDFIRKLTSHLEIPCNSIGGNSLAQVSCLHYHSLALPPGFIYFVLKEFYNFDKKPLELIHLHLQNLKKSLYRLSWPNFFPLDGKKNSTLTLPSSTSQPPPSHILVPTNYPKKGLTRHKD